MPDNTQTSRLEQRAWAAVISLALLLGGWWLQNQYDTTLRIQEQLATYMLHVDDKYVKKDYLGTVTDRLERIEDKIDGLHDKRDREGGPR